MFRVTMICLGWMDKNDGEPIDDSVDESPKL